MPSTLDAQTDKGIFALFKGESGVGKSNAALSFPNPYVFDFDRKMPAISLKHFPNKDVHYGTFGEVNDVINKLEEFKDNCPYETIISDSVTSLCDLSLNTMAKIKGDSTKKLFSSQGLQRTKTGVQMEMMSIDYYNGEFRLIKDYWIDALKALWIQPGNPKHVIVIAHVLSVESAPDLKTRVVSVSRSIVTAGRKVGAYIPTQFDEAYHFTVGYPDLSESGIKRFCYTEFIGDDFAKTAYRLPNKFEFTNANFYEILNRHCKFDNALTKEPNTLG